MPPDVIGVGVGDCYGIETRDPAGPQVRRHHILAKVQLGTARADGTTGVDEEFLPVWGADKN